MVKKGRSQSIFIVPGLAWVVIFTILPLLYTFRLSFFSARLGADERFVGLNNFLRAGHDYRFWNTLGVSVFFVLASVTLTVLLGLGFALLFNRPLRGQRVFRTLLVLPLFTAPIALGWMGLTIFSETSGPVNGALTALGVTNPPGWFHDVWGARAAIVLVDVWQWTPFCFLVLVAALEGVPKEFYESARLETSSRWEAFRRVTLPSIAPALSIVIVLRLVETFKVFDIPFSMTSGGPGSATLTYSYYVYQVGLRNFNRGYGSALAVVLLIIMLVISSAFFARLRRTDG
jgi:multiple sugar transport system permease protein